MKTMICKVKKILNNKMSFFHLLVLLLVLVAYFFPFIAGYYSGDSKKEELSNYISDVVENSTRSKNIMSISIGTTPESGALPLRDEKDFYNLYGIFKQENITYASGFNVNKEIKITIPDFDNDINYSIFYNAKDSTVEYKGHYKHWYYPIEYMFPAVRLYDLCKYMIYLTQSQADLLLQKQGAVKDVGNEFKYEDYKSLIKQKIYVNIDDTPVECIIGNIIYEQNYYYNGLKEVLGNFIACAYYCPGDLSRTNLYFFNNYSFQNSFFMNYINQTYSNKLYDVQVVKNNVITDFDYNSVTDFYYHEYRSNMALYIVFIILSLLLLSIAVFILFVKGGSYNVKFLLLSCLAVFIPYLIFFFVSHFSHSILFFSNNGITLYTYLIIYFIAVQLVLYVVSKIYKQHLRKKNILCKR